MSAMLRSPLGVLDDLGGFRDPDRRRPVDTSIDKRAVDTGDDVECSRSPGLMRSGLSRHENRCRISSPILVLGSERNHLQWHPDRPSIHRRRCRRASARSRPKTRSTCPAGCPYRSASARSDEEISALETTGIYADGHVDRAQIGLSHLPREIEVAVQLAETAWIDVIGDGKRPDLAERKRDRQSEIAQTDDVDFSFCGR